MSIIQNHIKSPDGFTPAQLDSAVLGVLAGVANVAGAAAGDSVTTTVPLPTSADLPAD